MEENEKYWKEREEIGFDSDNLDHSGVSSKSEATTLTTFENHENDTNFDNLPSASNIDD